MRTNLPTGALADKTGLPPPLGAIPCDTRRCRDGQTCRATGRNGLAKRSCASAQLPLVCGLCNLERRAPPIDDGEEAMVDPLVKLAAEPLHGSRQYRRLS